MYAFWSTRSTHHDGSHHMVDAGHQRAGLLQVNGEDSGFYPGVIGVPGIVYIAFKTPCASCTSSVQISTKSQTHTEFWDVYLIISFIPEGNIHLKTSHAVTLVVYSVICSNRIFKVMFYFESKNILSSGLEAELYVGDYSMYRGEDLYLQSPPPSYPVTSDRAASPSWSEELLAGALRIAPAPRGEDVNWTVGTHAMQPTVKTWGLDFFCTNISALTTYKREQAGCYMFYIALLLICLLVYMPCCVFAYLVIFLIHFSFCCTECATEWEMNEKYGHRHFFNTLHILYVCVTIKLLESWGRALQLRQEED